MECSSMVENGANMGIHSLTPIAAITGCAMAMEWGFVVFGC
jgi:hypothetical protein